MAAGSQSEHSALRDAVTRDSSGDGDSADRDPGDYDVGEVAAPCIPSYHPSWAMVKSLPVPQPATQCGREYLRELRAMCSAMSDRRAGHTEPERAGIWACASDAVKFICVRLVGLDRSFGKMPLRKFDSLQRAAMHVEVGKLIEQLKEVQRALGSGQ